MGHFPTSAVVTLAVCAQAAGVSARAETLTWRHTMHMTEAKTLEVPDQPGHVVGTGGGGGIAFLESGEAGALTYQFIVDYVHGSGKYTTYTTATFEDGSTLSWRYDGMATMDLKTKITSFTAKVTFTQGTGRFAGITGEGTGTGKRLAPLGGGAEGYFDCTATYTLSGK